MFLGIILAATALSAVGPMTGPVGLVLPVANSPSVVEQLEVRTSTLPDGTVATERIVGQIYRDSAGRVRMEWHLSEGKGEPDIVYLLDPVAHSVTILLVEPKIAEIDAVPGDFQVGLPTGAENLLRGKWQTKVEALGTRLIEGVEVEGQRTLYTSEDKPPLTATYETWSSKSLGLKFIMESSGEEWKHTAKLQHLKRQEPDPSLFVIPPDYSVRKQ